MQSWCLAKYLFKSSIEILPVMVNSLILFSDEPKVGVLVNGFAVGFVFVDYSINLYKLRTKIRKQVKYIKSVMYI